MDWIHPPETRIQHNMPSPHLSAGQEEKGHGQASELYIGLAIHEVEMIHQGINWITAARSVQTRVRLRGVSCEIVAQKKKFQESYDFAASEVSSTHGLCPTKGYLGLSK